MARIFQPILLLIFGFLILQSSVGDEVIWNKVYELNTEATAQSISQDIINIILRIKQHHQLLNGWYRMFLGPKETQSMIIEVTKSFRSFVTERLGEFIEESIANIRPKIDIRREDNEVPEVRLSLTLNKTDIKEAIYFLNLLGSDYNKYQLMCNKQKSVQQTVLDIYKRDIVKRAKAILNLKLKYKSYNLEQNHEMYYFGVTQPSTTDLALKTVIESASREIWRCDPREHKKGVTYADFDNRFRTNVLYNKLTKHRSYASDCAGYGYFNSVTGKSIDDDTRDSGLRYPHPCAASTSFNCRVSARADVCLASENPDHRNFRRPESCDRENSISVNASHCLCDCEDKKYGYMYVDLSPVNTDVKNNYVVTGIRLRKELRKQADLPWYTLIFIDVQQGELLSNGQIDTKTLSWRRNTRYSAMPISSRLRRFQLSSFEGDDDEVAVGAKFTLTKYNTFVLEPVMRSFNFSSGKLLGTAKNFESRKTYVHGAPLKLVDADVPVLQTTQGAPNSQDDLYVELGPSSFEKDRGQTTVPFLDIQEVVTGPAPRPVAGLGLYHKAAQGYGGFLAAKLIIHNQARDL